MAAVAGAGHIAGFYQAQFMFRNSNGYPMGTQSNPDGVGAGTTTHSYLMTGPVEAGEPTAEYDEAEFFGGQSYLGKRDLGLASIGSFDLTLSARDEVLESYITATTADVTTVSSHVLTAPNVRKTTPVQGMLALTMGWQDSVGTNKYLTYLYHSVSMRRPMGGASSAGGRNPNARSLRVTPTLSTRTGLGYLFSATGISVTENSDIMLEIRHDNFLAFTTYVAANAATTFVLGFRPLSTDVLNTTNVVTKNGVTFAPVSISATTGVVTIASATTLDIYNVAYPTNRVAI